MSKTAIIVRGQPRTWKFVSQNNLAVFKKLFQNIDWFFCFSVSDTLTEDWVRNDFAGENIVSVEFCKDENYVLYSVENHAPRWKKFPVAYNRQAYLEYHASLTKREYEISTGIRYNSVFALRPDCYFFPNLSNNLDQIGSYQISGFSQSPDSAPDLVGADFCFLAGDVAANAMSFRYLDSSYTDGLIAPQAVHPGDLQMPQYYFNQNLIFQADKEFHVPHQVIVRPNLVDELPYTIPYTRDQDYQNKRMAWDDFAVQTKVKWCRKREIDPRDYFLVQDFIKFY